tara:strand:- start:84 stop:302 length:219 start_codon:yes stop_codon:yes gene_type:complete
MAVNEKRINLIEKKMVLHDEQIARLFSDVTTIKDTHNKMVKMFVQIKGILIGVGGLILLQSVGVLDALKIMM